MDMKSLDLEEALFDFLTVAEVEKGLELNG